MSAYAISGKGVQRLKELLRGNFAATGTGYAPATVSPDEYAAPYTVRWAQSVDNGSGSWIIYLVNDDVLRISDETIPITTRLTAAGNPYPTGWYKIPSSVLSSTGGNLWLVVDKGTGIAGFSGNAGSSDTWSFRIALCWRSTTTLETGVVQLVNSAIIFDQGGGGNITAEGIVVMSVDYVTSSGDDDFAAHPYAIRIRRGRQTYDPLTNVLTTVEDANLKQFIETVPHSSTMD